MNQIKCPHCGEVFQVDEAGYAQIARQVRDAEFARDVAERERLMREAHASAIAAAEERSRLAVERATSAGAAEVSQLKAQVKALVDERDLVVAGAVAEERRKGGEAIAQRDARVAALEQELASARDSFEAQRQLAVATATSAADLRAKELEGQVLRSQAEREQLEASLRQQLSEERALRERELRDKDDEIERIRNQRLSMSTKMLGESLERHCEDEFNKVRAMAFPNAEFAKDTIAVSEGEGDRPTKGDYIFRECAPDGTEVISIMFEMKTEQEDGVGHRTNESHLKKLDADRRKKGCEYAVLVSTLEPESELYNQGIVDVSWKYPKMFVIRPQFFIPLIGLLRGAALSAAQYRVELAEMRRQNIDVTNFEKKMNAFKEGFGRDVEHASKNFANAIKEIDAAIDQLKRVRDSLTNSERYLRQADKKAEDQLTVRKLTWRNPTMKALFDEAREAEEKDGPVVEPGDPADAEEPDSVE